MSSPIKFGTTVEILAPYLPYGLHVCSKYGVHHRLVGLSSRQIDPLDLGTASYRYYPDEVLPVLRSLEYLVVPLEDGTVPAVEVAKLQPPTKFSINWPETMWQGLRPVLCNDDTLILLYREDDTVLVGYKLKDLVKESSLAVIDYLRRNLFAIGLEPDQYIRML